MIHPKKIRSVSVFVAAVLFSAVSCGVESKNDNTEVNSQTTAASTATSGNTTAVTAAETILKNVKAEDFIGTWECFPAMVSIAESDNGSYFAFVTMSEGNNASEWVEWEYPLEFKDGKMVCMKDGYKYDIGEPHTVAPDVYDSSFINSIADRKAEFYMTEKGLIWNDFNDNKGENMVFTLM